MRRDALDKKAFLSLMRSLGKKGVLPILASSLLLTLSVVLQILAPTYLKEFTDQIADGYLAHAIDMEALLRIGITLISFYVAVAISGYLANYILTTVTQRYAERLRNEIARKINRVPLRYFDSHQHGEVLSTLTNDVDQIGNSLQQSVGMVVQSLFMLVGVLIAMFSVSWQMALAAMASLPLMAVFVLIVLKMAMPRFKRRQDGIAAVNALVEEIYKGHLIIKAFRASGKTGEEFRKKNEELREAMFQAQCLGGLFQPFMSFMSYFAYAAVFLVGGLLMNEGAGITFGTIAAFLVYVSLFQSPLSQLAQAMNTLQMAGASASRVFSFLEEEEMEDESFKKPVFLPAGGERPLRGEVVFENVSFSYDGEREIIHGFSAKVEPGMKVAIVGPTGAGKTTMVNLLMRFYEIDGGRILIDGVPLSSLSRDEVHRLFGMVLQDSWVFRGTIRENLAYNTPGVSEERIRAALKDASLAHYVQTLPGGLDHMVEDPGEIAGGQRQLLTIARAEIKDAPLLILDEATSNVDTRTEERIQEAMDRLMEGRTSFVIAHRLSTIKNADLILVLKDGDIVEQGTHDSLMEQGGFYKGLYEAQFSLGD